MASDNPATFAEVLAAIREATTVAPPAARGVPDPDSVFLPNQVDRITFHDFATYEMIFDPWAVRDPRRDDPVDPIKPTPPQEIAPPPPKYLPDDLVDLDDLSSEAEAALAYFLDTEVREALEDGVEFDPAPIINLIYRFRYLCGQELSRHYQPSQIPHRLEAMLIFFVEEFLADLLDPFQRMRPDQQAEFFTRYYDKAVRDWVIRARNLELPWVVGAGPIDEWLAGGYIVGEAYGRVPKESFRQYVNGKYILNIRAWVTIPNQPDPLAHEYAWAHNRTSYGIITDEYATSTHSMIYFAPLKYYESNAYVSRSPVLVGALQILSTDNTVTPTEIDELTAAAGAMLSDYDSITGNSSDTTPQTPAELYGFEPYPTGSINLGMRIVYRQAWRPRGIQPGELVRTIPLAPGQKERYSIKYQERNKLTRQMEDKVNTETTEEYTSQTKNSSEIVEEAAKSNKWHIDTSAKGSFNIGVVGVEASTNAGYASDSSKASKETKSRLSETMQKTARASRRESRVQVSLEHEETFETERASEITNPNQEIAITCFYETVQQIYTVKTALEGLDPVVFVAERIPPPSELNINWIRRYDWIINRVLLDESFRETLNLVSKQHPDFKKMLTAEALGLDEVLRLSKVLSSAETSLASINSLPGAISNTYEATLNAYQGAVARARTLVDDAQQLLYRIKRLRNHIADNILYYCRAIWTEEDPDRRMMRYSSIRLPTRFTASVDLQNVETDPLTGQTIYTGAWDADPSSWRPLSDVIHPAGPIAYAGNYAVYRLRYIESTAGLSRLIRLAEQAYYEPVAPAVIVSPPARAAALNIDVTVENEDFYSGDTYLLRISAPQAPAPPPRGPVVGPGPAVLAGLEFHLFRLEFDGSATDLTPQIAQNNVIPANMIGPFRINFGGLHCEIQGALNGGDEFTFLARPPLLVDPEIKYRRLLNPEASLDELRQQIEDENIDDIVVDTNNIWLNLIKGTGTVLEDFKLEHRRIDVELARVELARRFLRLDQNILADPDIEKKVIIQGPALPERAAENEAVEVDDALPPEPQPPDG